MNWIVGNLQHALDTWNGKLAEIYTLVTQSPADFINKLSIALKEANETEYWLNSLYQGKFIDEKGFQSMFNDNEEIIKILVKSIKTVKNNNNDK